MILKLLYTKFLENHICINTRECMFQRINPLKPFNKFKLMTRTYYKNNDHICK